MFKNSDSFGDADMKEQLKQMEVTIHELLVTDAELPDMSAQISELQLEHRKFTQEVLRVTPIISAGVTTASTGSSSSIHHSVKLPRLELPTFNGDQEQGREFWETFSLKTLACPILTSSTTCIAPSSAMRRGTSSRLKPGEEKITTRSSPCHMSTMAVLEKPVASHYRGGIVIRWTRLQRVT